MKINIRGLKENDDPFYRYKMDSVIVKIQKGLTHVPNIDVICKDLDRDPKTIADFLKKKFGTSVTYKNSELIIPKILSQTDLQEAIYEFIDKFVMCVKCNNPETVLSPEKKNSVNLSCKSCGNNFNVNK
jgi:translation initiation factor 5